VLWPDSILLDLLRPHAIAAGLAGSVLDAKLNRTKAVSWFCTRRADWRVVFLSFREVLSPACLCDELLVFYDSDTHTCAPPPPPPRVAAAPPACFSEAACIQ
jgi:hypothetical protein